jgi:hypothetical protein
VKEHLVHFIYKYILVNVKLMDLIELTVGCAVAGSIAVVRGAYVPR